MHIGIKDDIVIALPRSSMTDKFNVHSSVYFIFSEKKMALLRKQKSVPIS